VCRSYDCRTDKRIWIDFENRIPAPWPDDAQPAAVGAAQPAAGAAQPTAGSAQPAAGAATPPDDTH
jgi:hypothetical protein